MMAERATSCDAAAILALLQHNDLTQAGVAEHLGMAFVARDGVEIVGCVVLEVYGARALLRSLAVDRTWRGRGLGQQLTRRVLDLARDSGVADVYLLTETAATFFPRFGFVAIDRAAVSPAIHPSVEWTSACPAHALVMHTRPSNRVPPRSRRRGSGCGPQAPHRLSCDDERRGLLSRDSQHWPRGRPPNPAVTARARTAGRQLERREPTSDVARPLSVTTKGRHESTITSAHDAIAT